MWQRIRGPLVSTVTFTLGCMAVVWLGMKAFKLDAELDIDWVSTLGYMAFVVIVGVAYRAWRGN